MNSGCSDKYIFRWKRFVASFRFALNGLRLAAKEPNFRFHLASAAAVAMAGFWLSLTRTEWLFILIMIFGVMALEVVNTAIEKTVDLVTEDLHPLAKEAKDLAAGAVLLFSCLALLTGAIIFLPKVWRLF
ncbi:diacylglycerol kinase family protein [Bacillus aerolatus]|uniref:Diacylglycerol kinase family protein n=1 Tax=Bacillus aerolatus TaxID=2653354 RepID=A0A6I1FPW5_9BACI|nr:diacylglycerol kinase family protein [Bacillus aerolatus]KAB7708734.1 diacylglycerol kinase family protein [Bacillus aerolatus]